MSGIQLYDFSGEEEIFPIYRTFFNIVEEEYFYDLLDQINLDALNFENSQIYDIKEKENVENNDVRQSKKHKLDNKYFPWVQKFIVDKLNKCVKKNGIKFILVKDDLEIVKYEEGDFFQKHHDFVKVQSNQLKCYSLLYCLRANCDKGRTILYLEDTTLKLNETIVPNGCLVFRNEVIHEGEKVKGGHKYILKVNLWAINNQINEIDYDNMILLQFDNGKIYPVFKHIVENKKYLKLFSDIALEKDKKIYFLKNITSEQFEIIYKILMNNASLYEIQQNIDICEKYNIIDEKQNILITAMDKQMHIYYQKMCSNVHKILNSESIFIIDNINDYDFYYSLCCQPQIIEFKNIIPFQIIKSYDKITYLTIGQTNLVCKYPIYSIDINDEIIIKYNASEDSHYYNNENNDKEKNCDNLIETALFCMMMNLEQTFVNCSDESYNCSYNKSQINEIINKKYKDLPKNIPLYDGDFNKQKNNIIGYTTLQQKIEKEIDTKDETIKEEFTGSYHCNEVTYYNENAYLFVGFVKL